MAEIQTPYVIPLSAQKPKSLTLVPSDPGSRYKTRQLQVQIVGKSKMIKTVLLNILDVAKDCQVPPSYVGTFMGYVIGAQAKFDLKKPERQQAFISGEHDPKDLSKIFQTFIMEVLLCPTCGLPEILIQPEGKAVMGSCRACGSHSELKITDEKFKRYVLNHPPSNSKSNAFEGNKAASKKDKKDKGDKDDDKKEEKEKEVVVEKPKKSKVKEEDVVWFSDTSDEAAKKRREAMLPDSINIVAKDAAETEDVDKLVAEAVKEGADSALELKKKKTINDQVFVKAVFGALFSETCDLLAEIKAKSDFLLKVIKSNESQVALLEAVENFLGKVNTSQLAKTPLILKELYDREILDEDNIFTWDSNKKTSLVPVREQAAPMIKWLKEAEEDDDDEDEEDDE